MLILCLFEAFLIFDNVRGLTVRRLRRRLFSFLQNWRSSPMQEDGFKLYRWPCSQNTFDSIHAHKTNYFNGLICPAFHKFPKCDSCVPSFPPNVSADPVNVKQLYFALFLAGGDSRYAGDRGGLQMGQIKHWIYCFYYFCC